MKEIDLGFKEVKTKELPYWHREDEDDGPGMGFGLDIDDDDEYSEDQEDDNEPESRTSYPELRLHDTDPQVAELPDEGTITIRYRKIEVDDQLKTDKDDKDKRVVSVTLEVQSIELQDDKPTKRKPFNAGDVRDSFGRM